MKLFGRSIFEKLKGYFVSGPSDGGSSRFSYGGNSWLTRCRWADRLYERQSLAKSQTLTIAGQFLAGITDEIPLKAAGDYDRAREAMELCRELNNDIRMSELLFDSGVNVVKYGSCFWEKTDVPIYSTRLLPLQQYLEPERYDASGVLSWRYGPELTPPRSWSSDEVIHFKWNVSSSTWPYGTSLYTGLDSEFETLEQLEYDIKEYMHKNAFPLELYQVGDDKSMPLESEVQTIRREIQRSTPGQKHVTNYAINHIAGGVGDREIRGLDTVLTFLKDQCIDGLMMPPISKQYNATEASAKEMMPWAFASLINPLHRIFSDTIKNELYAPYLTALGFSVKVVPSILWEPPESNLEKRSQYYAQLVGAGIMPPRLAARELGWEEEWLEWDREKKAEQEKLIKREDELRQSGKLEQKQSQSEGDGEEGKGWVVRELVKHRPVGANS